METVQTPAWESLFDQALSILNQARSSVGMDDSWTFGGGTALMLQIDHRESFDIDIFIDAPQFMPFLNPQTQSYTMARHPDAYQTDGVRVLKLAFEDLGEIDFICASHLTESPTTLRTVRGAQVNVETPAEIIAKKIVYRGASLQPRDMFDIACVARSLGDDYVTDALGSFRQKATAALAVARSMNPAFAQSVMRQLPCRKPFEDMPGKAQAITIELLESVCSPD